MAVGEDADVAEEHAPRGHVLRGGSDDGAHGAEEGLQGLPGAGWNSGWRSSTRRSQGRQGIRVHRSRRRGSRSRRRARARGPSGTRRGRGRARQRSRTAPSRKARRWLPEVQRDDSVAGRVVMAVRDDAVVSGEVQELLDDPRDQERGLGSRGSQPRTYRDTNVVPVRHGGRAHVHLHGVAVLGVAECVLQCGTSGHPWRPRGV